MTATSAYVRERQVETLTVGLRTDPRLVRLTPAELRVAIEIARGLSTRDIARTHRRSEHTINNQIASLLAKLGVGARAEVVRILSRGQAGTWGAPDCVPPRVRRAVLEGRFQVHEERESPGTREFDLVLRPHGPCADLVQLAHRCALAHPLKVIAIDDRVVESTISGRLARFMLQTKLRDRAQLIRLMVPLLETSTAGTTELVSAA